MKNVTVTVPEDVYRDARIRAAEQGTSLSALVADYLRSLSKDEDAEFIRLRQQQRRISQDITDFSGRDRLGRDDLHDRAALR